METPASSGRGLGPVAAAFRASPAGEHLVRNWWLVVLRGVFAVLFGLIAFVLPTAAMLTLLLVFSAYAVLDGGCSIVAAYRAARRGDAWKMTAFEGVASVLAGVFALLWPGLTVIAFVLLVAAWALISGGLMVGSAIRLKGQPGRGWLAASGVVSILFGVLLLGAPLFGAVVLTWWLGAYVLVFGVTLIVLGIRLKSARGGDPPEAAASQGT
jgi:uncharacterized membrane protein HdeD (DUF308 family)